MIKSLKKIVSLAAALSVFVIAMAGCASGGGANDTASTTVSTSAGATTAATQASESPKALSADLKLLFSGEASAAQDKVTQAIVDKLKADGLDFKLEFIFVPANDYANRQSLVAASDEDVDITWTHISSIKPQIAQKMFAPLDDALKAYGSELTKNTPDYVFKEVIVQGSTYAIPRVVPSAQNDWVVSVRGDLREKYGVPEIKTLEDFEAYAEALYKNEKQMTPIWLQSPRELYRVYNPTYYFPAQRGIYIDLTDKDLKVRNYYESDAYKQFCEKYYEWVKKGWATKDSTQLDLNSNDFIAGKMGTCYGNVMFPTEKIDMLKGVSPAGTIEIVNFNPDKPRYIATATDNLLSVFAQSKKVNESVAFINWIRTSQENYDLMSYGIQGATYNLEGDSISLEGIAKENSYTPKSYCWTDLRFNRYSKNVPAAYIDVIKNWDKDAIQSPLLGISLDTEPYQAEVAKLQTVYEQYNKLMEHGLIKYGDKKNEMLEKAKAAGIDKIISEIQKQVDAFMAGK